MDKTVVFDVETPNRSCDRICSIGITLLSDNVITDNLHYLVNPETYFDAFCTGIHGISSGDVADAPTFDVLWAELAPLFRSSLLVAHNAVFDMGVLSKVLAYYGINEPPLHYACTVQMARRMLPGAPNHKLNTLSDLFGIELDHHHADSDSLACAKILQIFVDSGLDVRNYTKTYYFRSRGYTRL